MRSIHKNVPVRFAPYEWVIKETDWTKENSRNNETIFTVANGYLGIRGFFEEKFDEEEIYADRTTMINGIYEYHDYHHMWCRPGFPERFHAIVGQANPFDVTVYIDGEKVELTQKANVSEYERVLDMQSGYYRRTLPNHNHYLKGKDRLFSRHRNQTELPALLIGSALCCCL